MNQMTTLDIGIACHNRKAVTYACLESIKKQNHMPNIRLIVLDDGSTDGTTNMVQESFPNAIIIQGTGELFWARSMSKLHTFSEKSDSLGFLMLNDDVLLEEDALSRLTELITRNPNCIIVGATKNSQGDTTYSGLKRIKKNSLFLLTPQLPSKRVLKVDSFVGNFVFIPRLITKRIGILEKKFSHHYADVEYGIRATKASIPILLMPNHIGFCEANNARLKFADSNLPLRMRFQLLNSRICYPVKDHILFYSRIGTFKWPFYFVRSYLGKVLIVFFPKLK